MTNRRPNTYIEPLRPTPRIVSYDHIIQGPSSSSWIFAATTIACNLCTVQQRVQESERSFPGDKSGVVEHGDERGEGGCGGGCAPDGPRDAAQEYAVSVALRGDVWKCLRCAYGISDMKL